MPRKNIRQSSIGFLASFEEAKLTPEEEERLDIFTELELYKLESVQSRAESHPHIDESPPTQQPATG